MSKEVLNFENLFAGPVSAPVGITVAVSQTIKRGDLLECVVTEAIAVTGTDTAGTVTGTGTLTRTVGTTFAKPSAVANIKNIYVVAAEDITTGSGDSGKKINAFPAGVFNQNSIVFGGSSTAAQNFVVLLSKGIYLKDIVKYDLS